MSDKKLKSYDNFDIIKGGIKKGEIVLFIAKSRCGKSKFLQRNIGGNKF